MRVTSDYNLGKLHTELVKEWHPTKNEQLTPFEVTPGSHKKVWWICNRGHEWNAVIYTRKSGAGCPYCAGKKASEDNNLVAKYPDLAKQWHSTKNGKLKPSDVTPKSGRKVWWRCGQGHEWNAEIKSRSMGRGCPYCKPQTSRLEIRVYCELKAIFDDVKWRDKIDGIECDVYLPKYKVGVELDGYPWHKDREERDRQKGNQFLEKGVEVFRVRDKKLRQVAQTDIFYRRRESHISVIKKLLNNLMVNISFTHQDKLNISGYLASNRLQNIREYKEIISLLPGPPPEKSLAQLYPTLVNEWNYKKNMPLNPIMFTSGSHRKVWWICSHGHEWTTAIYTRTSGHGCPYCAGKKVGEDNNLAVKYPNLAKQWHSNKNGKVTPKDVTPGSGKKVWWICSHGHEWKARVVDRAIKGSGCPKCRYENWFETIRKTVLDRSGSLADKYPDLAKQWHPTKNKEVTSNDITPGSDRKVWWICSRGHEWDASVSHRVNGRGCPKCSYEKRGEIYRKAVVKRSGSLADKFPDIAKEWHPSKNEDLSPFDVSPGSNKKIWWRCNQGHDWDAIVGNRTRGSGCPKCYLESRHSK